MSTGEITAGSAVVASVPERRLCGLPLPRDLCRDFLYFTHSDACPDRVPRRNLSTGCLPGCTLTRVKVRRLRLPRFSRGKHTKRFTVTHPPPPRAEHDSCGFRPVYFDRSRFHRTIVRTNQRRSFKVVVRRLRVIGDVMRCIASKSVFNKQNSWL